MSKLDEMIRELCPDGVEYVKLGTLCSLITKQTGFDYTNHIKARLLMEPAENAVPYIQTKFFAGKNFNYQTDYYVPMDIVEQFPKITLDETVVLLSHKKADSYIHIDVEFGEGEGKIPVDSIAKRAEAYKPKEKVTYKMIKEYIEAKYGFKVHTAYIAEVKRNLGLPMYDAPNAVEELKQPRKHPTPEKVEAIKDALRYFAVI